MADDSNLSCINVDNSLSKQEIVIDLDTSTQKLINQYNEKRELANHENARALLTDFNSWLSGLDFKEVVVNDGLLRDLFLQWVRLNLILKPFVDKTKDPQKLWDGFYKPFLFGDYSFYKNYTPIMDEEKWLAKSGDAWKFTHVIPSTFWESGKTFSLKADFWKQYRLQPEFGYEEKNNAFLPWSFLTGSKIPGIADPSYSLGVSEPKKAGQFVATSKQACIRKWNIERFLLLKKDLYEGAKGIVDPGAGVIGDTLLIVGVGIAGAIVLGFTVSALLRD